MTLNHSQQTNRHEELFRGVITIKRGPNCNNHAPEYLTLDCTICRQWLAPKNCLALSYIETYAGNDWLEKYEVGRSFWVLALRFQKTHKCETLISDGRDIYPNNGCLDLQLRCTKMSRPIRGRVVIYVFLSIGLESTNWCEDLVYLLSLTLISYFLCSFFEFWSHDYKLTIFSSLIKNVAFLYSGIISLLVFTKLYSNIAKKYKFYTHPCPIQCEI